VPTACRMPSCPITPAYPASSAVQQRPIMQFALDVLVELVLAPDGLDLLAADIDFRQVVLA